MFPDFNKMQEQAADAIKRAEARHVEQMKVLNDIRALLEKILEKTHRD